MSHCLLGKLSIRFVRVGYKRNASCIEHANTLDLAPFCKVTSNNLLDIVRDMDPPNVYRPVLAGEASNATHIIAVVAELVASEAVDIRVEEVV